MATVKTSRTPARAPSVPSPAAPSAAGNDRLCLLLLALVGSKVVVTVKGGQRFQGILGSGTSQGEVSIALRQAQLLGDAEAPVKASLVILARDLVELEAVDVSLEPRTAERDTFKTDTDITGVGGDQREKQLQAWGGDSGGGGIEDSSNGGMSLGQDRGGSNRPWDQFATNERLFGATTDYDEEIYTTKLDRTGADYRAREQRAAQLEREILKGTGNNLANNAHMAEERGAVDDSGLDEEDRYGAVIRGANSYVPPGARKATLPHRSSPPPNGSQAAAPPPSLQVHEPPASAALSRQGSNGAVARDPPSLDTSFRQFVVTEKERLVQKREAAVKAAEKKEQDSRLASLREFSQNFKLKSPLPADVASILGRDVKKVDAVSSANTPTQSPVAVARNLIPTVPTLSRLSSTTSTSTLIAEIPPFNPKSKTPTIAPASLPPKPAAAPTASTSKIGTGTKINANAPAFVFKPNPNASAFTPSFASNTSSPSRVPAELPANPFFGNKVVKKGSSSMHVKEDFTPFKNGVVPEPRSIVHTWAFTGKPYRSMYPAGVSGLPAGEDDPNMAQLLHHAPPAPPQGYVYQAYQPAYNRFQPGPPHQQQAMPHMPHMPPPIPLNGNLQFQHYAPMGFPPMYPNPQMQQQPPPQQQQFVRYPPQFPPQQGGPPLSFEGGRPMGGAPRSKEIGPKRKREARLSSIVPSAASPSRLPRSSAHRPNADVTMTVKAAPVRKRATVLSVAMRHQLEISLGLLIFILAGNALTTPGYHLSTRYTPAPSYHLRSVFSRFLFLSFQKPGSQLYFKGRDDAYLITFWIILFWFVREASMRWIWEPLARWAGVKEKRSVVRFAEQGWNLLYYSVFLTLGVYILQTSPYRNLETKHFYTGYPHDALPALTKWYYMVQTSFWLQQIIVLNLEARRKDYLQMFAHHIITVNLMMFSYVLNWTRVGNAILVLMDFVDILLPLAKLFVYTKKPLAADITFGTFMLAWIATRHVLYGIVLWSVYFELPSMLPYDWRPQDGYFNSFYSHQAFFGLLLALQLIIIVWFTMICRVAYRAVTGRGVDDERSEAGSEDEEETESEALNGGESKEKSE